MWAANHPAVGGVPQNHWCAPTHTALASPVTWHSFRPICISLHHHIVYWLCAFEMSPTLTGVTCRRRPFGLGGWAQGLLHCRAVP
jgi:hypothetical protein